MKKIFLIIILFSTKISYSQNLNEKMATKSCECLELIGNKKFEYDDIKQCITNSYVSFIMESAKDEKIKMDYSVEGIRKSYFEIFEILKLNCSKLRDYKIVEVKTN